MGSETLSQATNGQLTWRSNAPDTLKAGQFAIEADGLSASNYNLKQDPANQTAMTVRPVETPAFVSATVAFNQQPLSFLQPSRMNTVSESAALGAEAVASASPPTKGGEPSGGIYEFCVPKPPSMLGLVSATCVRGKQP